MFLGHFLRKISLLILPVIVVTGIYEVLLRSIPNDYSFKQSYLVDNASSIEILILGSSHAFRGINPDFISNQTFNAAYISQTIDLDEKIFSKYSQNLKNLKALILPISYSTLYNRLEYGKENWRIKNYKIYYGLKVGGVLDSEVISNSRNTNFKRIQTGIINGKSLITCNSNGWATYNVLKSKKSIKKDAKNAVLRHNAKRGLYNNNLDFLSRIHQQCQEQNVPLILVTIPVSNYYFQNMSLSQWSNTKQLITDFVAGNDGVTYHNFISHPSFTESDFYNSDHLNEKGAEKFSLILEKIITE